MRTVIHNPSTWYNLNRLRDYILDFPLNATKISLLIDCSSGEINIQQPISDLAAKMQAPKKKYISEKFKHAELYIETSHSHVSFELRESDQTALGKIAAAVMTETLNILNQAGAQSTTAKDALLSCIRAAKMELNFEICNRPGWRGAVGRVEAERLLEKAPIGTYVLREGDQCTKRIEYNLAKNNPFPLRCYVMTIVEQGQKISDKILVQQPVGWTTYNDELLLGQYSYTELTTVISKLGGLYPLKGIGKAA